MMMTNLFSIFDPSMSIFSFSWTVALLVLSISPSFYWLGGMSLMPLSVILKYFGKEVTYNMTPKAGTVKAIASLFLVLGVMNFLALFPNIFSITSHVSFNLPLAYSLWVGCILFSWVKSLKGFLSHLIPVGTPLALMSFMVLVEILSNLIRPMALTFRLTANMMAGHLLMSLIGGAALSLPFSLTLMVSLVQSFLVVMEIGVSLIQAYVFTTLILLYYSESE